jgi:hypothetical protein
MRQPLMTAYRQEALRCAALLAAQGPLSPAALRAAADVPRAGRILQDDVYGWFERVGRALYGLTPEGRRGLERFDWPATPMAAPAVPDVPRKPKRRLRMKPLAATAVAPD